MSQAAYQKRAGGVATGLKETALEASRLRETSVSEFENAGRTRASVPDARTTERHLRVAICGAMFAGLALSPKLWTSDRVYPLTPVAHFLGTIPTPWDQLVYAALLIVLGIAALVSRPAKWIVASVTLALTLAVYDQSRWQPWFYQYLVMLTALWFYHRRIDVRGGDHDAALNACRLIVVCTYFWSGWQKVHAEFITRSFPWLIEPFSAWLPHAITSHLSWFGAIAPFIEIGMGIGLLTRRFRRAAIATTFAMHAFILIAIGPWGRNYNMVVWPWNVAMCAFVVILFRKRPAVSAYEIVAPRRLGFHALVLLLYGFMPLLSFFGLWDGDLSSALYAEVRSNPLLYVSHDMAMRLPDRLKPFVYGTKSADVHTINIFEWSLADVNACTFPEPRVYKNIARTLCSYARTPSDLRLVIQRKRVLFSPNRETSYSCEDLTDHR